MKKKITAIIAMMACLMLLFGQVALVDSYAAEVVASVEGTVESDSTASLIKLNTNGETMLIKVDSSTDFSACKNLLPGRKVVISVSYGSDAYMHAVTVRDGNNTTTAKVDSSNQSTVYGKITSADLSTNVLKVSTPQGLMELKLDPNTDLSGCTMLAIDKYYEMSLARGSDAYMHIVSIKDSSSNSYTYSYSSSSSSSSSETTTSTKVEQTVEGRVGKSSNMDVLILKTDSGEMELKLNQLENCKVPLYEDVKIKVGIAYGSDAYWHAITISKG